MSLEIAQIRHVGLFSSDPDTHARFYSDIWGLERVAATPDVVFLRGSSSEHFILSLHRGKARGLHHIAYAMPNEDAVRAAATSLLVVGTEVVDPPHRSDELGGGYLLRFVDPVGGFVEL